MEGDVNGLPFHQEAGFACTWFYSMTKCIRQTDGDLQCVMLQLSGLLENNVSIAVIIDKSTTTMTDGVYDLT